MAPARPCRTVQVILELASQGIVQETMRGHEESAVLHDQIAHSLGDVGHQSAVYPGGQRQCPPATGYVASLIVFIAAMNWLLFSMISLTWSGSN